MGKWCKGDCVWDEQFKACADKKTGEGHHYHQRVARENDEHGTPETPVRTVSCGKESAKNCGECPKSADPSKVWEWCSGECVWDEENKKCGLRSPHKLHEGMRDADGYLPSKAPTGDFVSCGKQHAVSCDKCPPSEDKKQVWKWCTGDCVWHEKDQVCAPRAKAKSQTKIKTTEEGHIIAAEL